MKKFDSVLRIAFVQLLLLGSINLVVQSQHISEKLPVIMSKDIQHRMTPAEALQKLKEGNFRFVNNQPLKRNFKEQALLSASAQYPFAFVLSCIDSRTSSEIIFDQGIGDIFSARIAGNVVNTDILGSMEFACKIAGAKLILVVGHSSCGAIKGACDHVVLGNLSHVLDEIQPAIQNVKNFSGERSSKNKAFVDEVTKQNVSLAIKEIRENSPILRDMEKSSEILIIGALYDLETGKIDFYTDL